MSALESKFENLIDTLVPLAALSSSSRTEVLDQAEVLRYRRGDILFKEGDRDAYTIYLLEGRLELRSDGQVVQRLSGGTSAAAHPIAQLQPRKMTARAETEVAMLRVARDLLDRLMAADGAGSYCSVQVNELDASADDDGDWMTRMLQSELFSRLPASNIHRIFSLFEEVEVGEGEEVVSQGAPGDFYYIIAQGRCEVMRSAGPSAPGYRLALIGPGDAFGEEALVAGSSRNATVRMLCDGQLVRLPKEAFIELIQKPLLSGVSLTQGQNILATKPAVWLDVRFPEEHQRDGVPGSVNHPLNTLRMHSGRLDGELTYVVYCDTGTRSAVAAFLLAERGFDVHYLEGGLMRYELLPNAPGLDLSVDDATSVPSRTAPAPTSQKTARELPDESAGQAAALSVATDLARREAELAAAQKIEAERQRITAEMQRERAEVERRTAEKLRAEKKRIQAAAVAAHRQLTEAQRLKAEIEQARGEVQAAAAAAAVAHAARGQADSERLKAEVARARLDAETAAAIAAARRETQEAQRLKDQLERVRADAEAAATAYAARDQVETASLRAEIKRARAEAEAAATAAAAVTVREAQQARRLNEELERVRAEVEASVAAHVARDQVETERLRAEIESTRAAAEVAAGAAAAAERETCAAQRLKEELERARAEVEASAAVVVAREARESQRLKNELEHARAQAEAAAAAAQAAAEREAQQMQRMKEEFERARVEAQASAAAAAERDRAEAERLKAEIERARAEAAQRELAEAQRIKAEIERAKADADAAVQRERDAQRERVEQVRAEMERRLQEEERKLRASYAWQAEELKRLQSQKAEAEVRLREEQERVRVQADESRARLAEARDYQRRLEEVQLASAHETEMREQQQLALERKLREELRHTVQTERRQLEQELARNAAELDRARREREAAAAARRAAAAEAEQIVAEFKDAHARKRMQEEAEMRFERERLEADARCLRLALELAQREKQAALQQQSVIELEIADRQRLAVGSDAADESDLCALQAQAQQLAEQIAASDRAQADTQAAAVASAGDLAAHRVHEERVRASLKSEIDEWLHEQDAAENSDSQRGILANQRAHLDRIKQRVQAVRAAAKAHDQALINELADKLKRGESE